MLENEASLFQGVGHKQSVPVLLPSLGLAAGSWGQLANWVWRVKRGEGSTVVPRGGYRWEGIQPWPACGNVTQLRVDQSSPSCYWPLGLAGGRYGLLDSSTWKRPSGSHLLAGAWVPSWVSTCIPPAMGSSVPPEVAQEHLGASWCSSSSPVKWDPGVEVGQRR